MQEIELKIPLNVGIDQTSVDEAIPLGRLKVSENTRLTARRGTSVKCPGTTSLGTVTGAPECMGAASCGGVDSTILYMRPKVGQKRVVASDITSVQSTVEDATPQNIYFPAEMTGAGPVTSNQVGAPPSVVYDPDGRKWFAYSAQNASGLWGAYVAVHAADGSILVPSWRVESISNYAAHVIAGNTVWVSITMHGSTPVLWYRDDTSSYEIACRTLTLAAGSATLTVGAAVTVSTPSSSSYITIVPGLAGGDATYAWVLARHPSTAANMQLIRITVATGAITTSATIATGATQSHAHSLSQETISGVTYIFWAASVLAANNVVFGCWSDTSGTMLWGPSSSVYIPYGLCIATAISVQGSTAADRVAVLASWNNGATPGTAGHNRVMVGNFELATGAQDGIDDNHPVDWMALNGTGCGATWTVSDTERYALFSMRRRYGSVNPFEAEDPCAYVMLVMPYANSASDPFVQPIAKFGLDSMSARFFGATNSLAVSSSGLAYQTLCATYLVAKEDFTVTINYGSPANYVEVDLGAQTHRTTMDASGVSYVQSAMPALWDGVQTAEIGVNHKPVIYVAPTGGSGTNLTGTYAYCAVYEWVDAKGNVHRSAPSLPYTVTPAGTKPRIWVTKPFSYMDGRYQASPEVKIYATEAGGSVFYLQSLQVTDQDLDGCWQFDAVFDTTVGDRSPQLFSDGTAGSELFPAACPPAWDMAHVGNRLWVIDAEKRQRILPSKEKTPGLGIEFAAELEIAVDGSAGKLVACVEYDGDPLVFAERGAYRISGEGPNNYGQGSSWSRARLISNTGCIDKRSVAKCPVGVMYATSEGSFELIGPGGTKPFKHILYSEISGWSIYLEQQELVYTLTTGGRLVYNWETDAWTTWAPGAGTSASGLVRAHVQSGNGTTIEYLSTGAVTRTDPDTFHTTLQQSYCTGWVFPGGDDQADCSIRDVTVQAIRVGAASITVNVYVDYEVTATTTKTWSSSEMAALRNDNVRVTLNAQVSKQNARAVMVEIVESGAGGDAFNPLFVTIAAGIDPGRKRRAILAGGRK